MRDFDKKNGLTRRGGSKIVLSWNGNSSCAPGLGTSERFSWEFNETWQKKAFPFWRRRTRAKSHGTCISGEPKKILMTKYIFLSEFPVSTRATSSGDIVEMELGETFLARKFCLMCSFLTTKPILDCVKFFALVAGHERGPTCWIRHWNERKIHSFIRSALWFHNSDTLAHWAGLMDWTQLAVVLGLIDSPSDANLRVTWRAPCNHVSGPFNGTLIHSRCDRFICLKNEIRVRRFFWRKTVTARGIHQRVWKISPLANHRIYAGLEQNFGLDLLSSIYFFCHGFNFIWSRCYAFWVVLNCSNL